MVCIQRHQLGARLNLAIVAAPDPGFTVVDEQFGGLQKLLAASVEELEAVDGLGEARARGVREAISRLADASIIDRYP